MLSTTIVDNNKGIFMNLKINRVYQHKSGSLYTLLAVSNLKATKDGWEQQAVYIDKDNVVWTRPAKEFEKKMQLTDLTIFSMIMPLVEFDETKIEVKDPEGIIKYPENGF